MKRKLNASMKNAQAMPNALMIKPAGAGPSRVAIWNIDWNIALADGSCSRSTSTGRRAWNAGSPNASATPHAATADRAAAEHDHRARPRRAHEHRADSEIRAGELQHEPRKRDEVELV